MRQWGFVVDMNYDGALTISDVSLWLKWLYFYPGDLLVAAMPDAWCRFFEIAPGGYGGPVSNFASLVFWSIAGWFCFFIVVGHYRLKYQSR